MVIAIGGVSRAGKTKLTKLIKNHLSDGEIYSMCQDDYAYAITEIPKIKELTDWECPASINFGKVEKELENAIDNYDHVILEGFLAFHNPNINQYYERSIFIDIKKDIFIERRLRDSRWEAEPNWYIDYVWESYLEHGRLPKGHEALIIDGTQPVSEDDLLKYLSSDKTN